MSFLSRRLAALLVALFLSFSGHANADAIGARLDTRLSANRVSGRSSENLLSLKAEDLREKGEALQTAAKKTEADVPIARRSRAVSDEMRAKKTRSVVARQ
jgi:hypothetical protein